MERATEGPDPDAEAGVQRGASVAGGPEHERQPTQVPEDWARRRGLVMASKFLGRLSQLTITDLRVPVEHWRRAVSQGSTQWFVAESAAAEAMRSTDRHVEQEMLLEQLVDLLRRAGWMRHTGALEMVGASEASVQYTATLAILALLLQDRLSPRDFSMLYSPFAPLIPLEELGPE